MLCFREHILGFGDRGSGFHYVNRSPVDHPFGQWLICQMAQSDTLKRIMLRSGFWWAEHEGDVIQWRWRFWEPSIGRGW